MSPMLDIARRHAEVFRLRLGERDSRGNPRKLTEAIRVTSHSRTVVEAFVEVYGGTPQPWASPEGSQWEAKLPTTEISVMVLPGQSLSQWWEQWKGSVCARRCDGVTETLSGRACMCPADIVDRMKMKPGEACRPMTRINVICPDVEVVGAGGLVSHGLIAAETLPQSISIAEAALTRGLLVPAVLRVVEHKGKRHYVVPQIEIVGVSLRTLETGERSAELAGPPQKAIPPPAPAAIEAPKAKVEPKAPKAKVEPKASAGGITDAQLRKLHALLRGRGVGGDERHGVVSELVGHEVASTKDLTKAEASEVIDKLAKAEAAPTPATEPASTTTAGSGVFVRAVQTALARAGLEGADAEGFIAWVTDGKGLDGPGPSNAVLAAAKRFDAGKIVLTYAADGTPTFAEKASA